MRNDYPAANIIRTLQGEIYLYTERTADIFQFCIALLTMQIMTAESMLSKRPVLSITVAVFLRSIFRAYFSSLSYFCPILLFSEVDWKPIWG